MNDTLTDVATEIGRPYGMSAADVLAHVAIGDCPHGDARPGECGVVDPRRERRWCRLPAGHDGDHNAYGHMPPSACGVLLAPPDPYDFCRLPTGHDGDCSRTVEETA